MEWSGARASELMLERQVESTLSARRRRPRASPTVIRRRARRARPLRTGQDRNRRVTGRPVHPSRGAGSLPLRPRPLNHAAGTKSPAANPHRKERRAMSATTYRPEPLEAIEWRPAMTRSDGRRACPGGATSATPYPYTPSWRDKEMTSEVRTHPGRLFLLVLFTAATVLASVEQVVAHAGNTSPSVIHACVNRTNGNTRIVGPTGSCTAAEDATHWGIVGPQGPQGPAGPAGIVASFDNLAGLACTLNGTVGTVAILYATNGDATLRCVVAQSQPPSPPAAGIAGTYDVTPVIHFECVFGLAQFTVTGFVFTPSTSGSTLTVTPIGLQDRDMTGVINGNHFSV